MYSQNCIYSTVDTRKGGSVRDGVLLSTIYSRVQLRKAPPKTGESGEPFSLPTTPGGAVGLTDRFVWATIFLFAFKTAKTQVFKDALVCVWGGGGVGGCVSVRFPSVFA